jgi:hypothetical protein
MRFSKQAGAIPVAELNDIMDRGLDLLIACSAPYRIHAVGVALNRGNRCDPSLNFSCVQLFPPQRQSVRSDLRSLPGDVRFWPKADITVCAAHFRFRG